MKRKPYYSKKVKTSCALERIYINMYDAIGSVNENLQHAGYGKTFDELKERYSYIPRKLVVAFVNACSFCTSRWPMLTNICKPIIAMNLCRGFK